MTKINVTLRKKASTRGDRQILYLDFYPQITVNGKQTRRQMLHLFTYDHPRDIFDREHNAKAKEEAAMMRMKRDNELNKPEIYNEYELEQLRKREIGEGSFSNYLKDYCLKHQVKSHDITTCFEKHVKIFAKEKELKFSDISEKFCAGFKNYLLTAKNIKTKRPLVRNTAHLYYSFFKIVLNLTYKDGHLPNYLGNKIGSIGKMEVRRNYLSLDELNSLAKAPCTDNVLKRASLFSGLTGLRFSDIEKLTWQEVEGQYLKFCQRKTGGVETLPISDQALLLMGDREQGKPFEGLVYGHHKNIQLKNWITSAGIERKITFHCFRHTYATLQLGAGTDIYTVSKMLGHRDLKTTQIYAHLLDQSKQDATTRITLNL